MNCIILMRWVEEARVWIATSKDVPGLVLEDSTFEALVEEVKLAVPTLLKLNNLNGGRNNVFGFQYASCA